MMSHGTIDNSHRQSLKVRPYLATRRESGSNILFHGTKLAAKCPGPNMAAMFGPMGNLARTIFALTEPTLKTSLHETLAVDTPF